VQRRAVRLTEADEARVRALVLRSRISSSRSAVALAALDFYASQQPLTDDAADALAAQLKIEDHLPSQRSTITLLPTQDSQVDHLQRHTTLSRRFSFPELVRTALLLFSSADDATVTTALLMLPPTTASAGNRVVSRVPRDSTRRLTAASTAATRLLG
jgi:hypothetical protein